MSRIDMAVCVSRSSLSNTYVQYERYDSLPRSESGFSGDPTFPSSLVSSYAAFTTTSANIEPRPPQAYVHKLIMNFP